jgi:hypothetical protein
VEGLDGWSSGADYGRQSNRPDRPPTVQAFHLVSGLFGRFGRLDG